MVSGWESLVVGGLAAVGGRVEVEWDHVMRFRGDGANKGREWASESLQVT